MVDVLDDHRMPVGRDLARETLPDRDAHPLLDLFLDPLRGTGDELVGRLVEQEEGARVGLQSLGDAVEKGP
jgi:hypothetical protein